MNEEDRRELRRSWSRIVRAGWRIVYLTGRRGARIYLIHTRQDAQLHFAGPDLLSVARVAADTVAAL